MNLNKKPIITEIPITNKTIECLFKFILKNLYKKICIKKYVEKKIIQLTKTCIQN